EHWRRRDPIPMFRRWLLTEGEFREDELAEIEAGGLTELEQAFRFADNSPYPEPGEAERDVYFDLPHLPYAADPPLDAQDDKVARQLSYAEALAEAQAQAMRRDPKVFLIGLDIG